MNFQEILNYRNKCVICQRDMIFKCKDYKNLNKNNKTMKFVRFLNGLIIHAESVKGMNIRFNYDGTYKLGNQWYGLYASEIIITKHCPKCTSSIDLDNRIILYKYRGIGASNPMGISNASISSFNNICSQGCSYSFVLCLSKTNEFKANIISDHIRYYNGKNFWHLNSSDNQTEIYEGKIHSRMDNILHLQLPQVNTSKINNTEDLINKIKMLTLMS